MTPERDLERRFAALLAYPKPGLAGAARACAVALASAHPEAAALVTAFATFVEATPPGRLEEIYSGVFELDAAAPPYVSYHLFGESYKRSVFLLRLRAACRQAGVDPGAELADHLAIVLRLLAATEEEELRRELVEAALLPALERMTGEAGPRDAADGDVPSPEPVEGRDAYGLVLRALRLVLAGRLVREGSA